MDIHHDLKSITLVALSYAKEHNVNYNIIMMNHVDGKFSHSAGSTYEFVRDSYFEKERPFAVILHRTDDLIAEEQKLTTSLKTHQVLDKMYHENEG